MEIFTETLTDETARQIARIQREYLFDNSDENAVKAGAQSGILFFVEFDGQKNVVNFCSARQIFEELEIYDLATVYEYQNRGIAKKTVCEVLAYAQKNGVKKVYLEVRESNQKAINLYSNLGFEKYALRKNYYAAAKNGTKNAENAVCMSKEI